MRDLRARTSRRSRVEGGVAASWTGKMLCHQSMTWLDLLKKRCPPMSMRLPRNVSVRARPPMAWDASSMHGRGPPRRSSSWAVANPAGPAPMMSARVSVTKFPFEQFFHTFTASGLRHYPLPGRAHRHNSPPS